MINLWGAVGLVRVDVVVDVEEDVEEVDQEFAF